VKSTDCDRAGARTNKTCKKRGDGDADKNGGGKLIEGR